MDLSARSLDSRCPRWLRGGRFVDWELPELIAHSTPSPLERYALELVWWAVRRVLWPCGLGTCRVRVHGVSGRVGGYLTCWLGGAGARPMCDGLPGRRRCLLGCSRWLLSSCRQSLLQLRALGLSRWPSHPLYPLFAFFRLVGGLRCCIFVRDASRGLVHTWPFRVLDFV